MKSKKYRRMSDDWLWKRCADKFAKCPECDQQGTAWKGVPPTENGICQRLCEGCMNNLGLTEKQA